MPTTAPLSNVRVLVVDDDTDSRELAMLLLTVAGATVEGAESAAQGYELLKSWHPDVLVSDIAMPDEDGLSLLRRVRSLSASEGGRVPALALSAYADEDDRRRGFDSGFDEYIAKPANPTKLTSIVARLAVAHASGG